MAINKVETIDDRVRVKTVLVSVSDKTGLDLLIRGLLKANSDLRILSTGGSHAAIAKILGDSASRCLQQVSDYTGQPEMQGGLVKTLDFKVYLGLLSETHNPAHQADLARTGAVAIDMVIVNLNPFKETIARSASSLEDARGNIDIGGPCMLRASAKNFHRVAALTDPADYAGIVKEISESGGTLGLATRFRLAQKAFLLTAGYDQAIAGYLSGIPPDKVFVPYHVRAGG
jgi:phosphoribosylaminoimidazolecarboxamide formyltransferase/IMP cyclohydrolase